MALDRAGLVLRINEIWHDLENRAYDGKHPEILDAEVPRWDRLAEELLGGERGPASVLDLGSGTGFVPLRLLRRLRPGDALACSDLSAAMLDACRAALEARGVPCALRMVKLDGTGIPLPPASFDLVTVNAVLHHAPDPAAFLAEAARVLRPGGRLVVAHEPGRAWHRRAALRAAYHLALPFADWKQFGYQALLATGLFEPLRRPLARALPELARHNELLDAVNAALLAEGAVDRPLAGAAVSSLLDVNSPTAGGTHAGRGFAREDFARWLPGFALERLESYNHLGKLQARAGWTRALESALARRWPEDGASLTVVLRKPPA